MKTFSKGIDIVIPIYNGYDDISACMESIRNYTDLTRHRVILVNDCSPDPSILPLLQSMVQDGVVLINSEVNGGFSASVNKGMQYDTERDVILLNSDTKVTAGWVEKIVHCAYSRPEIGTVTPLSNAATLCSYPIMCADSPIPEDTTLDELAALVEKVSLHHYPRITVANGFCMFIKREVIRRVGWFDAATFERGYGEENDFCNRAEQMGYIHVMCDDTFIYHKGTGSFLSEEKKRLIEAHSAILDERYPEQMRNNHLYCMANPEQYIRDEINIYRRLQNHKKTILFFSHLDFHPDAKNHVGGTQYHIRDLVLSLKEEYNAVMMARDGEFLRVTIYTGQETSEFRYYIGEESKFVQFRNGRIASIVRELLKAFEVDAVHVHHVAGLSLDIFYEAAAQNIPILATMHDFYMICPTIKMINSEGRYCGVSNCDEAECNACLAKQKIVAGTVPYISLWREECHKALALCERIITPSEDTKRAYAAYYPDLEARITPIPHGLTLADFGEDARALLPASSMVATDELEYWFDFCRTHPIEKDYVAGWAIMKNLDTRNTKTFLAVEKANGEIDYYLTKKSERGDIVEVQGNNPIYLYSGFSVSLPWAKYQGQKVKLYPVISYGNAVYRPVKEKKEDCSTGLKKNHDLNVAFLGGLNAAKGSKEAVRLIRSDASSVGWFVFGMIGDEELLGLNQKNLTRTGAYDQRYVKEMLQTNKIDVVCILSIWPETFCYTLSESWEAGIPVIAVDLGAMGDRIRESDAGWVVPVDRAVEATLEILEQIKKNPKLLEEKKAKVRSLRLKTREEMVEEYRQVYKVFKKRNAKHYYVNYENVFKGYIGYRGRNTDTEGFIYSVQKEMKEGGGVNTSSNAQDQLNAILSSRSYRWLMKLKKLLGRG